MTDQDGAVIRSASNSTIKLVRSLRQRSARETERAFVVEGPRAISDALRAGGRARLVLVREGAAWNAGPGDAPVRVVAEAIFDRLAETETPQPVLAVFEVPVVPRRTGEQLVLVADGIGDPGNLGTLLRSAAGAGATAVAITPGTVDPYNGKVVRAAMGAHFRIPILRLEPEHEAAFAKRIPRRVLAESGAGGDYATFDWRGSVALVIGSEAHGPTELGRRLATVSVCIPLENGVESLNAAAAGAVLLFEAAKQRRAAKSG